MASTRTPPIPPSAMTPEQKAAYKEALTISSRGFGASGEIFIWAREEDGALLGPFHPFIYHPQTMQPFVGLNAAAASIPGLSQQAREVAILTVGHRFASTYELYAHRRIAASEPVNFSPEQIRELGEGRMATGLDEQCQVAFEVARELCGTPGPLKEELWHKSVKILGRDGALALMHYVAFYAYLAIMLNAVDVPAPE